jgi:hypothetical protein
MTIRNATPACVLIALCTACQPAPAHADGLPDKLPPDPAAPAGVPPPLGPTSLLLGGAMFTTARTLRRRILRCQ